MDTEMDYIIIHLVALETFSPDDKNNLNLQHTEAL